MIGTGNDKNSSSLVSTFMRLGQRGAWIALFVCTRDYEGGDEVIIIGWSYPHGKLYYLLYTTLSKFMSMSK